MSEQAIYEAIRAATTADELADALVAWAEEMVRELPGVFTAAEWVAQLESLVKASHA